MNALINGTRTWFVCPRPNPQAQIRLIAFPYSGATASVYHEWSSVLPSIIEVHAVQLPGRANRLADPLLDSVDSAVSQLVPQIERLMDRPTAFFGHSLGAVLAFECARQLNGNPQLSRIFVSAHRAPQSPDHEEQMHPLPDDQLIERLKQLNGMAPEILNNQELLQIILPIVRADLTMSETYRYQPGPTLACPISAYGGLQDSYVGRDALEAWREQTTGVCSLRMFPGDHFYLQTSRTLLLRAIASELIEQPR